MHVFNTKMRTILKKYNMHPKKSFVLFYVSNYNTHVYRKKNCTNELLMLVYPLLRKKHRNKPSQPELTSFPESDPYMHCVNPSISLSGTWSSSPCLPILLEHTCLRRAPPTLSMRTSHSVCSASFPKPKLSAS